MPRLTVSVNRTYQAAQIERRVGPTGRPIRHVKTVMRREEPTERPAYSSPLFFKITAWLALIAAVALAIATWRLFHFPH